MLKPLQRSVIRGGALVNLLEQTDISLKSLNCSWDDVSFVGTRDGKLVIPLSHARGILDVDYNDDYGDVNILKELIVVTPAGILTRWESEGSEGWRVIHNSPVDGCQYLTKVLLNK